MMEAMEEHSWFDRPIDKERIVSNLRYKGEETRQQYINVLLPTSL